MTDINWNKNIGTTLNIESNLIQNFMSAVFCGDNIHAVTIRWKTCWNKFLQKSAYRNICENFWMVFIEYVHYWKEYTK